MTLLLAFEAVALTALVSTLLIAALAAWGR